MNTEQHLPPVIGIDLGGTQIRAAVLQGTRLLSRASALTGKNTTPERLIPQMYDVVERALDQAHMRLTRIAGMGIAAPGPLDSQRGIVFCPPNLAGWENVPLVEIFQTRYTNIPIFLENDANAAGLGEYTFGAGRGSKNYVYLTVSTGVGGYAILDGHILRGASDTAWELGHMTVDMNGDQCNCGNRGCLESIASGTAIARRAQEAINRGACFPNIAKNGSSGHQLDAKDVARAACLGVPAAKEIIQKAAEALGVALVNIIHILNPEIIVLGGGVMQIGAPLLEPAQRIVQQRAMKVPARATHITLSALGADVGLIGAGALVYQNITKEFTSLNAEVISLYR
jgi:glucokinase